MTAKKIIYSLCFFMVFSINAQNKMGVDFRKLNLEEAKELAQKENKLINYFFPFINFFALFFLFS